MSKKDSKPANEKTTVSLKSEAHQRASIAAALSGEKLLDFLTEAADAKSLPILKKHGVKLPSDLALTPA